MITREQCQRITGNAERWLQPLTYAMSRYGITNEARVATFLAQCAHESGGFKRLTEDLHYSAAGLLRVFKGRFTPQEAISMAYDEERIGNRAYANRLGNGDEASGDGFRFSGRGLIQVTGRANYRAMSRHMTVDVEVLPELLEQPLYAAESAAVYWLIHGLNALADAGDYEGITRAINGAAMEGLESRFARLKKVQEVLA